MTLVEFIAPLRSSTQRDLVLAALYYTHRYEGKEALTVDQIRSALLRARVPRASRMNVANVLVKSGALVDTPGIEKNSRLWRLTTSGEVHVRKLLALPEAEIEIEHDVGSLEEMAAKIRNKDIREYFTEAITCLSVGALRACVVFLWAGTIRTIQDRMLKKGAANLDAAIQKHKQNAPHVRKIEDFAYIKDEITLLAAEELGLLDKNQRGILGEALGLRNKSGHPGKYRPGPKKVSSYIEDINSIIFS